MFFNIFECPLSTSFMEGIIRSKCQKKRVFLRKNADFNNFFIFSQTFFNELKEWLFLRYPGIYNEFEWKTFYLPTGISMLKVQNSACWKFKTLVCKICFRKNFEMTFSLNLRHFPSSWHCFKFPLLPLMYMVDPSGSLKKETIYVTLPITR